MVVGCSEAGRYTGGWARARRKKTRIINRPSLLLYTWRSYRCKKGFGKRGFIPQAVWCAVRVEKSAEPKESVRACSPKRSPALGSHCGAVHTLGSWGEAFSGCGGPGGPGGVLVVFQCPVMFGFWSPSGLWVVY